MGLGSDQYVTLDLQSDRYLQSETLPTALRDPVFFFVFFFYGCYCLIVPHTKTGLLILDVLKF